MAQKEITSDFGKVPANYDFSTKSNTQILNETDSLHFRLQLEGI